MVEVTWTLQASADLESIAAYVAKEVPKYARFFIIDIFLAVERLAEFPESGRMVPELNEPAVRELIKGNYRIVYRLRSKRVEILTVYHGARLLDPSKLKGKRK